jgi:hypothetical protein
MAARVASGPVSASVATSRTLARMSARWFRTEAVLWRDPGSPVGPVDHGRDEALTVHHRHVPGAQCLLGAIHEDVSIVVARHIDPHRR